MQSKNITLFYLSHGKCRGSSAAPGLTVTGKANRISLSNSYTLITAEQWMNIYYYSKIGLTDEKKKKFQDAYKKLQKMNKKLKKQNRTSLRKSSSNKKCRTRIDTSNGTKNR